MPNEPEVLEEAWEWLTSLPVVRPSVAVILLLGWPARIDMFLNPTPDDCVAEFPGDFLTGWLLVLLALSVAHLFLIFWPSWWKNRGPSALRKIFWGIVLLLPEGYPVYYFFVYRKLDAMDQHPSLPKIKRI